MQDNKANNIQNMFNSISGRYDLLNHLLSFRRDVRWRERCIKAVAPKDTDTLLDLACGTGDMMIEVLKKAPGIDIIGGDFSLNMLKEAHKKTSSPLVAADACSLPFADESFDKITMAFGFRNVVDKQKALNEMFRVLKPGGALAILEFSQPKSKIFSALYWFYFKTILPVIGAVISRNKSAYSYLPQSVQNFPPDAEYRAMVRQAGFNEPEITPYDLGICCLMMAKKS